ncbi:GbsR/MarR family transcriptional regulator [Actinoplanes subtropicus]|uniref:GbsR/MarR family transcriptional regulator n=1 Tax=Actinoplanes subtropicus TaxID=543632 RepID=UPI000691FF73|nr:MarR family transcriptional regulator [Actinoplanes subtropicus]
MPGARLTYQDREQISLWLAAGLGYAEIARRLGRPTSTISREVARNHDSGAYRAVQAQQAATRRAPRRRPAPVASPPAGFAEEFATLLAGTGLPRMCARVFAALLVSDRGSLTASELTQQLSVSPASISKAVGYLEEMNLLSRTPNPGTRRERYVVGDDVWQRAWQTDTGAHASVADAARRGAELFGPASPAGIRLHKMAQFFGWLAAQMTRTGTPPPPTAATSEADGDPRTVLAALVHAARPLSADELATALGWPRERVAACLDPTRLTSAQRAALRRE